MPSAPQKASEEVNVKKALQNHQASRGSILQGWYHLLALYTSTNISFESDRLIAISSLAKEVQRRTGFRYLAGLWEDVITE